MKVVRKLNSKLLDFDKMDEIVHESLEGTEVELSEVKYKNLSEGVAYLGYDSNKGAVIATCWIGGGLPEKFDVEYPNRYYIEGNSADDHIYVCKEQTLNDVLSNPENERMIINHAVNSLKYGKYSPSYLPKVDMDLYGRGGYHGPNVKYRPALVGFRDYGKGFFHRIIKESKDCPLSELQSKAKNYLDEYRFVLAMNIDNPEFKDQINVIEEFLNVNYRIE